MNSKLKYRFLFSQQFSTTGQNTGQGRKKVFLMRILNHPLIQVRINKGVMWDPWLFNVLKRYEKVTNWVPFSCVCHFWKTRAKLVLLMRFVALIQYYDYKDMLFLYLVSRIVGSSYCNNNRSEK